MAIFPCSLDGARFRSGARYFYPAVLDGPDRYSARLRLCPSCAVALTQTLNNHAVDAQMEPEGALEPKTCLLCEANLQGLSEPVFVAWYDGDGARQDSYARVCKPCVHQLVRDWRLVLAS